MPRLVLRGVRAQRLRRDGIRALGMPVACPRELTPLRGHPKLVSNISVASEREPPADKPRASRGRDCVGL